MATASEPWEPFARGCLVQLGRELEATEGGPLLVRRAAVAAADQPPRDPAKSWAGSLTTRLRKKPDQPPAVEFEASTPGELLAWLAARLGEAELLPVFTPVGEPEAVHEIAASLFKTYTIDNGTIHLGGCHLNVTPLLRLTAIDDAGDGVVRHRYFDTAGEALAGHLLADLNLADVAPEPDPRVLPTRAAEAASAAAAIGGRDPASVIATVLRVHRVSGHFEVTIGDESMPIEFDGWARTLTAPPAVCPQSGVETHHLATLSDGRIAAAEEIVECAETGDRILRQEAVACSATHRVVGPGLCEACPVTGEPTLPAGFADCQRCGQRVSRAAITASGCRGCDAMRPAGLDDARLGPILAAAPKLAAHKHWKLAETETTLVAETAGWFSRWLLVVDKSTGEARSAAWSSRFSSAWHPLNDVERRHRLGEIRR